MYAGERGRKRSVSVPVRGPFTIYLLATASASAVCPDRYSGGVWNNVGERAYYYIYVYIWKVVDATVFRVTGVIHNIAGCSFRSRERSDENQIEGNLDEGGVRLKDSGPDQVRPRKVSGCANRNRISRNKRNYNQVKLPGEMTLALRVERAVCFLFFSPFSPGCQLSVERCSRSLGIPWNSSEF